MSTLTGGPELVTVGHGTLSSVHLAELLRDAGVRCLVDVRTALGSSCHPHFSRAAMGQWLVDTGSPTSGSRG